MPRKPAVAEPETMTLFDLPDPAPLPKVAKKTAKAVKAVWSRYPGLEKCDDCKEVTRRAYPKPSPPWRKARWKRVTKDGDLLLCHERAHHWRHADGLDIPESMRKATR